LFCSEQGLGKGAALSLAAEGRRNLAALITFLASGKTGYMSGTTIPVDGGMYTGTM